MAAATLSPTLALCWRASVSAGEKMSWVGGCSVQLERRDDRAVQAYLVGLDGSRLGWNSSRSAGSSLVIGKIFGIDAV
jgi:hypothetical protein